MRQAAVRPIATRVVCICMEFFCPNPPPACGEMTVTFLRRNPEALRHAEFYRASILRAFMNDELVIFPGRNSCNQLYGILMLRGL